MLFFKFTKWKDGTERYMSYRTNLIKYEHHFYPKYLQISGLPKGQLLCCFSGISKHITSLLNKEFPETH